MLRTTLELLYRGSRRFGVIDVLGLWVSTPNVNERSPDHVTLCATDDPPSEAKFPIAMVSRDELRQHLRDQTIDPMVGHERPQSHLIGAKHQGRIVSFVWVAQGTVPQEDNFSRSPHLGTSLDLPTGVGFVFNAWTDPEFRGIGLLSRLVDWHFSQSSIGCASLLATIDWTNTASQRALIKSRFQRVGHLWRLGRGRFQLSIVPDSKRLAIEPLCQHESSHQGAECESCGVRHFIACDEPSDDEPSDARLLKIAREAPGLRIAW